MARICSLFGCLLLLTSLAGCGQPIAKEILVEPEQDFSSAAPVEIHEVLYPREVNALTKRQEWWQAKLDGSPFVFWEHEADVWYSLAQYLSEPKIEIIADKKNNYGFTFEVIHDGKAIVKIHRGGVMVFRVADDTLYLAEWGRSGSGCVVAAYDMRTGKKRWKTSMDAVQCGAGSYTATGNEVTMDLGDNDDPNTIIITGHASYGDYVEVLDRNTGRVLAKKAYRLGSQFLSINTVICRRTSDRCRNATGPIEKQSVTHPISAPCCRCSLARQRLWQLAGRWPVRPLPLRDVTRLICRVPGAERHQARVVEHPFPHEATSSISTRYSLFNFRITSATADSYCLA